MTDYTLHTLSAAELLRIRAELARQDYPDEAVRAAYANAALLARCVTDGEKRLFSDAQSVLDALSFGEIHAMIARYAELDGGEVSVGQNASFAAQEKREGTDELS